MDRIPSTSNEKTELLKPDPVTESKKSSKSRKPKTPADRSPPQMRSLSARNDTHVSNFKELEEKNSQETVDKKESINNEKSSGQQTLIASVSAEQSLPFAVAKKEGIYGSENNVPGARGNTKALGQSHVVKGASGSLNLTEEFNSESSSIDDSTDEESPHHASIKATMRNVSVLLLQEKPHLKTIDTVVSNLLKQTDAAGVRLITDALVSCKFGGDVLNRMASNMLLDGNLKNFDCMVSQAPGHFFESWFDITLGACIHRIRSPIALKHLENFVDQMLTDGAPYDNKRMSDLLEVLEIDKYIDLKRIIQSRQAESAKHS